MTNIETATNIYWGILAIGIGALFMLFGVKLFRLAVGLAGFGAFGFAAYILVGQTYSTLGIERPDGKDITRLIISLGIGIIGGFISIWLWKVALISLGVLGGLGLAVYTLSWKSNGILTKPMHRTIYYSVLGTAGALASIFLETPIIIGGTALIGSISLFSGIDIFAHTGFNEAFGTLIRNKGKYSLHGSSYGMLASCGGSAVVGALIQMMLSRKKSNSKSVA